MSFNQEKNPFLFKVEIEIPAEYIFTVHLFEFENHFLFRL